MLAGEGGAPVQAALEHSLADKVVEDGRVAGVFALHVAFRVPRRVFALGGIGHSVQVHHQEVGHLGQVVPDGDDVILRHLGSK